MSADFNDDSRSPQRDGGRSRCGDRRQRRGLSFIVLLALRLRLGACRSGLLDDNLHDPFRELERRSDAHRDIDRIRRIGKAFYLLDLDPDPLAGLGYISGNIFGTGIGTQGPQPPADAAA